MDGIFLGFKIGLGFVLALAVSWWIWHKVAAWRLTLLFMTKTTCTFQQGNGATPTGWLTRDGFTDDWILWDLKDRDVLRCSDEDPPGTPWKRTGESLEQFLVCAAEYKRLMGL